MKKAKPAVIALIAASLMAGYAPQLLAMGGGGSDPLPKAAQDADFTAGKAAIDAKAWPTAIAAFERSTAKNPKNADAWNYLGFAQRNAGNYDAAFKAYGQALAIDPNHRGAHEYVGEAYLRVKNLAKAEEHLAALDKICGFGCAEYTELKNKIAAFKAGKF